MSKKLLENPSTLQTVHGTTKRAGSKEKSLFQAFKQLVIPRLARQEELAVAYEEASVRKIDAEGEKLVQEAAKLAAEKDLAKQQELSAFCENVDGIFDKDDPPHVVALKMAKLLETNPELELQLGKVQGIVQHLVQNKGCRILIEPQSESDA